MRRRRFRSVGRSRRSVRKFKKKSRSGYRIKRYGSSRGGIRL